MTIVGPRRPDEVAVQALDGSVFTYDPQSQASIETAAKAVAEADAQEIVRHAEAAARSPRPTPAHISRLRFAARAMFLAAVLAAVGATLLYLSSTASRSGGAETTNATRLGFAIVGAASCLLALYVASRAFASEHARQQFLASLPRSLRTVRPSLLIILYGLIGVSIAALVAHWAVS